MRRNPVVCAEIRQSELVTRAARELVDDVDASAAAGDGDHSAIGGRRTPRRAIAVRIRPWHLPRTAT